MTSRVHLGWLVPLIACGSRAEPIRVKDDARALAAPAIDAAPPCPGKPELCAACQAGSAASCTQIAYELPDSEKLPWYQRGCDGGDPNGCDGEAWAYIFVTPDHDKYEAARARQTQLEAELEVKLRSRCEAHDEDACVDHGIDLMVGHGGAKDPAEGLKIVAASCERHYARACTNLAHDDELSFTERAKWGKAACVDGDARLCGELVGLFGEAALIPGSWAFARDRVDRQCKSRDAVACWVLGGLYWTRDRTKAAAALDAACALDATNCDDKPRLMRGEKFLRDLGPLPTLDLKPLRDELKKQQRHER